MTEKLDLTIFLDRDDYVVGIPPQRGATIALVGRWDVHAATLPPFCELHIVLAQSSIICNPVRSDSIPSMSFTAAAMQSDACLVVSDL